jgi:hypothetical protein
MGLKSKVGLVAAKASALRINLNIQGCSVVAPSLHSLSRSPSSPPPPFTQYPSRGRLVSLQSPVRRRRSLSPSRKCPLPRNPATSPRSGRRRDYDGQTADQSTRPPPSAAGGRRKLCFARWRRRARQQDASRVSLRPACDGGALTKSHGCGDAHSVLRARVMFDYAAAWTRLGMRVARGRRPRRWRRGWLTCAAGGGGIFD